MMDSKKHIPLQPLEKIPARYVLCFCSALLCGLLAHGMTLFNKYSLYEDPSQLFGVGATYISGRWMLDILYRLENFFLGGSYSLPLVNGFISLVYLALFACLLVKILGIQKHSLCIALGTIVVTTPSLAGTFGYMFTAPHYTFATLLCIVGADLICTNPKWYRMLPGALLICCAIGIYQATLPIALCVLLLSFLQKIISDSIRNWNKYFLYILYLLASCLCFVGLYFVINKLYLNIMDAELLSYQGIDSMGRLSLTEYLKRAIYAYKHFLLPNSTGSAFMYPNGIIWIYYTLLGISSIITLILLYKAFRTKLSKGFFLIIPLTLLPLAVNFIFVMCDPDNVHSLMVYSHIMIFIYLLWSVQYIDFLPKMIYKTAFTTACAFTLLLSILYIRFDNICYLKAELVQQQTISYYTTMITQIKSTEGYTDDMPVAYVNMQEKEDQSVKANSGLDCVNIIPYYDTDTMINNFSVRAFMETWCGFSPSINYSTFADNHEFQEMPCYPDEGSIKIIDGVVVVKCG